MRRLSVSIGTIAHPYHLKTNFFKVSSRLLFGIGLTFCLPAIAEFRMWEGHDGSALEAEYVSVLGDEVTLRCRNGKVIKVSKAKLSDRDRDYLVLANPPRIKAKISQEKIMQSPGHLIAKCSVEINKQDSRAYPTNITAQLFVVGYDRLESDDLTLLDHKEWSYSSLEKGLATFKHPYTKPIRCRPLKSNNRSTPSIEIEGYIVVVADPKGQPLAIEESRTGLRHRAKELLGVSSKTTSVVADWQQHLNSDISIISAGKPHGNAAFIRIDGKTYVDVQDSKGRGLNLVALHNGNVVINERFDFLKGGGVVNRFVQVIDRLPRGAFVVAAVCDSPGSHFNEQAANALNKLGGTIDLTGRKRSSYYLIGMKGLPKGEAIEEAKYEKLVYP